MRNVKIIVPFAAGSANDASARFYADGLTRRWGKPVIVENRPGADAVVGGGAFANARDDHTLLYGTASMVTVSPLLQDSLPYDPSRDMVPIASTASSILVIAVHDGLPVRSLQELAELARAKPGELSWSSGPSLPHFVFEAMLARHGLKQIYIPYRDASAQQADFGEGRVHILSHALLSVRAPVLAGKARILAVTSPERQSSLPDVPTVAESGFPEMEIEGLAVCSAGATCRWGCATGFPRTCRRWPPIPWSALELRRVARKSSAAHPLSFPRPLNGSERASSRSTASSI
ncbi:Bug family tripartite tricarboxylate transporter substrate binding protein [Bradyrhizobium sp. USDA 3650]